MLRLALSALCLAFGAAAPNCSLTGAWFYSRDANSVITFGDISADGSSYNATCSPMAGCGWDNAVVALDIGRPWSVAVLVTFYQHGTATGTVTPGWVLGDCALNSQSVLYFGGTALFSAAWCKAGNANCSVPLHPMWLAPEAQVHLIEVSHSDIGWLGTQDDMVINNVNINTALDMMANTSSFVWQHECVLFARVWVEMYPEREAELVARIAEGRFDFGGTWTEPYEGTFINELLARQMYVGRKWAVTRWPGLDTAVTAFHQDGPLRALQTAQVYAKAGMRYLKPSRYGEEIVRWVGADGSSSLIAFPQLHYCTGAYQWGDSVQDIQYRMSLYAQQYSAQGVPPILGVTWGCDYAPPDFATALMSAWTAADGPLPPLIYSNFKNFLDTLSAGGGAQGLTAVQGERPNIWLYEATPTHHWMFSDFRNAGGRLLPAAEAFSSFSALALQGGSWVGYPAEQLGWAWLNVTLDDHGISGEPVPKDQGLPSWLVNDNSPPQWDMLYAEKWALGVVTGEGILTSAQQQIVQALDYSSAPADTLGAVVVFNTLSWTRDDVLIITIPAAWGINSSLSVSVVDAVTSETVPSQQVVGDYDGSEMKTYWQWNFTGRPQSAPAANAPAPFSLVFTPIAIPSLGYKVYWITAHGDKLTGNTADNATCTAGAERTSTFTSPFFSLTPGRGGLSSVVDLTTTPPVAMFDTSHYDVGEWMQLEYTGMGASETRAYPSPWVNPSTFQRLGNSSGGAGVSWRALECGPVRAVFVTNAVDTGNSTVQLIVAVYTGIPRLDVRVRLTNWTAPFGVVNRVVFPISTDQRSIAFATAYGVSRVGQDEAEDGFHDLWLLDPPATMPSFDRGYALRPREVGDWIHSEGMTATGSGVTLSSSVGCWDWVDVTGAYPATQPVLSPEMLVQTTGNRGPFLPEPGQHDFLVSIVPTQGGQGWAGAWKRGVQPNHPLMASLQQLPRGSSQKAPAPSPTLPLSRSFLSVSSAAGTDDADIWVTAVKKEEEGEGLIVRLFGVSQMDQQNVTLTVDMGRPVSAAYSTDLIELHPSPLPAGAVTPSTVTMNVGHWSIETLKLEFD